MPDGSAKSGLGKTITDTVLTAAAVIGIVGLVYWSATTAPFASVTDAEYDGAIERIEGSVADGDDHLLHVTVAETGVASVTVHVYDDEGRTALSLEHVYTDETTTVVAEDLFSGDRYRVVAIAPNGSVIGSATFTWQEGRK